MTVGVVADRQDGDLRTERVDVRGRRRRVRPVVRHLDDLHVADRGRGGGLHRGRGVAARREVEPAVHDEDAHPAVVLLIDRDPRGGGPVGAGGDDGERHLVGTVAQRPPVADVDRRAGRGARGGEPVVVAAVGVGVLHGAVAATVVHRPDRRARRGGDAGDVAKVVGVVVRDRRPLQPPAAGGVEDREDLVGGAPARVEQPDLAARTLVHRRVAVTECHERHRQLALSRGGATPPRRTPGP